MSVLQSAAWVVVFIFCFVFVSFAQSPQTLTLDEAINEAIASNLNLIAERYNLSVAEAKIITARLRPNPVLTVEGDHLPLLGTEFNSINMAGPPEYAVRTDFILERGGKRDDRIAVAENNKEAVRAQLQNTIRLLVLDVQNAFVDVLQARDNLNLARENLDAFTQIVGINQTRVRTGDLAEVEFLRTQLAQLQFENSVRQAELRLTTAQAKLRLLIGRKRDDPAFQAVGDLRKDAVPLNRELLRQQAVKLRPDLQAVVYDQARSAAELRLQIAQGKVDYTVGGEARRQQGLAGTGNSLGLFFSTNLPVFNKNQGEIERARQEQQQLVARYRALEASIDNDVDVAYAQYELARNTVERIEGTMLNKARDVRQITDYSYRRGEASFVEFLDATRAYNETIQTYNEARAEYARSLYLIDSVAGKAATQ
jgi:cobalt-zinc-cadmium efflux system outer membrane protein